MTYFVITGALGFLIIVAFIDPLKAFVVRDPEYWKAIDIVPIILLANLFLGMYHNLAIWYKLTDRTHYGMYFSLFGALITILLNVLLIPIIGFMASAYATFAAYGMMLLLSYVFGKKHYPVPYEWPRIGIYLLLAISFAAISYLVFRENFRVSGILLVVFLSAIYIGERKRLLAILRR
ncbi:hypothetical protein [Croceiramulus getboli]|nr:polysaccharide biosynthesis C-terminal domain-containing protein [Flavobacteriaceae bacterium YJPT1-3]